MVILTSTGRWAEGKTTCRFGSMHFQFSYNNRTASTFCYDVITPWNGGKPCGATQADALIDRRLEQAGQPLTGERRGDERTRLGSCSSSRKSFRQSQKQWHFKKGRTWLTYTHKQNKTKNCRAFRVRCHDVNSFISFYLCLFRGFWYKKKKKEVTITSGCPEALTKIVVGITKTDVAFVFLPFPLKRKLTWCTVSVIVHTYTTLSPIDSYPTTHCCFF